MNKYLSVKEVSEYLAIKPPTLYGKVSRKEIPHYKIGKLVRFKREEIDKWMGELKQNVDDGWIKDMHSKCKIDVNSFIKKAIADVRHAR